MPGSPAVFKQQRRQLIARLEQLARDDGRLAGLWLEGSLADGSADPLSDVDAYLAVEDASFDAVYADRLALVRALGDALAWSDATTPGLKAVHCLLDGPVKLDLFFEPLSAVAAQQRRAVRLLVDKGAVAAALRTGWQAPVSQIARAIEVIVRMTRQGGTWPVRLLHRGQWSTFAMMELDLIDGQIAQLMAVQVDPALFYTNPFSVPRHLRPEQRAQLDALTSRALDALARRDLAALRDVHLDVFDALVREGRAACAVLNIPYPIAESGDAAIRAFFEGEWPVVPGD